MTEVSGHKMMGEDPRNEINPATLFDGYTRLAPLGGNGPVMGTLEKDYKFEAEAPKAIGDLVKPGVSPVPIKFGQ